MNEQEMSKVLKIINHGWPQNKLSAETVECYTLSLFDLPFEQTMAVVQTCLRTSAFRPTIAEVRRSVFGKLGLLPPSAESALQQAIAWSDYTDQLQFANGSGYQPDPPPNVHPEVRKLVATLDTSHGSWTAQFTKAYAATAARLVNSTVSNQLRPNQRELPSQ